MEQYIYIISNSIFLMLPAGIANMSPVLFKWLPIFDVPIDFNKMLYNKPIFGLHKTYRGFFVGIICAVIITLILSLFKKYLPNLIVDFGNINLVYYGFLSGFGALFGDLVKSFFKRRVNVAPGESWVPFDQIDWILGSLIFLNFYVHIDLIYWVVSLLIFGCIHPVVNLIGYWLKIKPNRF